MNVLLMQCPRTVRAEHNSQPFHIIKLEAASSSVDGGGTCGPDMVFYPMIGGGGGEILNVRDGVAIGGSRDDQTP